VSKANDRELNKLVTLIGELRDVYYKDGDCPIDCICDPADCLEIITKEIIESRK
jgi:hypothetical protein